MGILFIVVPEIIVKILKIKKVIADVGTICDSMVAISISLLIILFMKNEKGLISCRSKVTKLNSSRPNPGRREKKLS